LKNKKDDTEFGIIEIDTQNVLPVLKAYTNYGRATRQLFEHCYDDVAFTADEECIKETAWGLFAQTGQIGYYMLYKALE